MPQHQFWPLLMIMRLLTILPAVQSQASRLTPRMFILWNHRFSQMPSPLPTVTNPFDANEVEAFLFSTFTADRTMLGLAQLECLKNDLFDSQQEGIIWKFIIIPEPIQNFGIINAEDRFEGYAAERTELLKFIHDNHIENVVFIAGDFH